MQAGERYSLLGSLLLACTLTAFSAAGYPSGIAPPGIPSLQQNDAEPYGTPDPLLGLPIKIKGKRVFGDTYLIEYEGQNRWNFWAHDRIVLGGRGFSGYCPCNNVHKNPSDYVFAHNSNPHAPGGGTKKHNDVDGDYEAMCGETLEKAFGRLKYPDHATGSKQLTGNSKTLTMGGGGEYWQYSTKDYQVEEKYGGRLRNMPDFCASMGEPTDAQFDLLEVVPGESGEDPTFKTLFESRNLISGGSFGDFHSTGYELPYHYTGRGKDDPGPLHQYASAR